MARLRARLRSQPREFWAATEALRAARSGLFHCVTIPCVSSFFYEVEN